jgi:hypothetical protein
VTPDELQGVEALRTPAMIRERCARLFDRALRGESKHFSVELDRLGSVADAVVAVTRENYPDLQIPYHSRWRHFSVGGVDRLALLDARLGAIDPAERARCRFDLVVTSVLLDAGAGPTWRYVEDGVTYSRSEGLGIASFHMFLEGGFSSDPTIPLRADAAGLDAVTAAAVGEAFQVTDETPLVGLEGRASLLTRLGAALRARPEIFGADTPRVGGLYDVLAARAKGGKLAAAEVLAAVLDGLGSIWPGRSTLGGVNLGDVWPHEALDGPGVADGLVPFHKLSQWLTYSLLEPLEGAGIEVTDLDGLTGLAEYRNGGLFVDLGVLALVDPTATDRAHAPGSELIVEWRALTVVLLDRVAERVREELGLDAASFPLAKVLEGGTWAAGRKAASERRSDGSPPIQLKSDGTVF